MPKRPGYGCRSGPQKNRGPNFGNLKLDNIFENVDDPASGVLPFEPTSKPGAQRSCANSGGGITFDAEKRRNQRKTNALASIAKVFDEFAAKIAPK